MMPAAVERRVRVATRHLAPSSAVPLAAAAAAAAEPPPPAEQPPIFEPAQQHEILAHFEQHGFCLIAALDTTEVARVNEWITRSQESCPAAWLGSRPGSNTGSSSSAGSSLLEPVLPETGTISYSLPLLDPNGAELDGCVTSPATLPVLSDILGGEACFSEFDIRETRDRDADGQMLFHHDFVSPSNRTYSCVVCRRSLIALTARVSLFALQGAAGASEPQLVRDRRLAGGGHRTDYVCSIVYLTDVPVDGSSPAFAVLPGSHRVPCWPAIDTPENRAGSNDVDRTPPGEDASWPFGVASEESQLRAVLGDGFRPLPLFGKAGTMVLYDISLFHTRSDPMSPSGGRTRRTMHTYVSRSSVAPLTDWCEKHLCSFCPHFHNNNDWICQGRPWTARSKKRGVFLPGSSRRGVSPPSLSTQRNRTLRSDSLRRLNTMLRHCSRPRVWRRWRDSSTKATATSSHCSRSCATWYDVLIKIL